LIAHYMADQHPALDDPAIAYADALRRLLPKRIFLVRHGESEGNADHTLYRTKADNRIELTERGSKQAEEVGLRIKQIIGDEKADIYVSPFQRTLQTARGARKCLEEQIRHAHVEPRIREQEFGNLQGEEFDAYRQEQQKVGRFWYRFPTGESGADVYDRVSSWWEVHIAKHNVKSHREPVDNVIVFTHGLTMRILLMVVFNWSPNTFSTVWNAGNCDVYILKKDMDLPATYPYQLDAEEGDMPKSTAHWLVQLADGETKKFNVDNYLSLPQPRTKQFGPAKEMLQEQHGIDPADVIHIDFFGGKFEKFA